MKSVSIKNIFEFKDISYNRAFDNYIANVGNFQGLGLPDICFISKKQSLGIFRSGFQEQSSFHFVQGLCHQSQAEVCTYIQSIVQLQEKNQFSSVNSQEIIINKIGYTIYDIFSKTLLVCELDLFQKRCHQLKIMGIQANKQFIQINKQHWEGAHISGILRAIDSYSEMCTIGKFYNEIRISNPLNLAEIIQQFFKLNQGNPTNIQKICSKSDFPSLNHVIYYLNWPLFTLFQYLCKSSQLKVLQTQLEVLDENLMIIYFKFIVCYKLKEFKECLQLVQRLSEQGKSLNLTKYLIAKVLIKLNRFEEAFVLLKDILLSSYENQIVWTTIASIFRKQHLFQISLLLLNQAAAHQSEKSVDKIIKEQNLHNYKVLTNCENLEHLPDLSQIYEIIHPQTAEKIESFVQLSGHPNFNTFLTRCRMIMNKDNQKAVFEQIRKSSFKPESKISENIQDFLMFNQLSDTSEHQTDWVRQVLKISVYIGQSRLHQYISKIFYTEQQSKQELDESNFLLNESEFQLTQTKQVPVKDIKSTQSLDISNHDSDEDEQPSFLKEKKHNLSFDLSTKSMCSSMKTTISPLKVVVNKKKFQFKPFNTYNNIIFEKTVESLESDNENGQQMTCMIKNAQANQFTSKFGKKTLQKVKIAGLNQYLNFTLSGQEESQIITSMKNRKEMLNSRLFSTINNICKVEQELERLFPLNKQIRQSISLKDTKSSLLQKATNSHQAYEIRNFYICTSVLDDNEKKSTFCRNAAKAEATFLYKCANLAVNLQKKDLALQILQKINSKMISVQIYSMLFSLIQDDHEILLKHIQKVLLDFSECGVNDLDFIPIWIETIIIKLTVTLGCNKMLGLLSTLEPDFTFKILKNTILRADNII